MTRKDFEIMAPVGSRESLAAALDAGTDAVYFGVEGLNMRSRSSANFTLDDLKEIAGLCSSAGVKTYLTVNTVMYDSDLPLMRRIIDTAREAGITAIIASDIAAIEYARDTGVEVHISTQVNITNTEAVRFYARWADVMVLARELNMEQVAEISRAIRSEGITGPGGKPVGLEMFCHGALCMAVSGKCYMSLHEMNSSANRGACGQVCRRSYRLTDAETGDEIVVDNKYLMSPKDLKTIHFLNKLVDAGVTVFKIEGRARGPEYVREVVSCYDEALKAICDWPKCSTVVSGMATIWDSALANGATSTAPRPHVSRDMPHAPYAISQNWVWPNSNSRPANSLPAQRLLSPDPPPAPYSSLRRKYVWTSRVWNGYAKENPSPSSCRLKYAHPTVCMYGRKPLSTNNNKNSKYP